MHKKQKKNKKKKQQRNKNKRNQENESLKTKKANQQPKTKFSQHAKGVKLCEDQLRLLNCLHENQFKNVLSDMRRLIMIPIGIVV